MDHRSSDEIEPLRNTTKFILDVQLEQGARWDTPWALRELLARFTTRIAEWDASLSGFERQFECEDRYEKLS